MGSWPESERLFSQLEEERKDRETVGGTAHAYNQIKAQQIPYRRFDPSTVARSE